MRCLVFFLINRRRRFVIFCKFKEIISPSKIVSSLHYCRFLNYYHISIVVWKRFQMNNFVSNRVLLLFIIEIST